MILCKILSFHSTEVQVMVFWVVTQCNDVVGYQCFWGPHCLPLQPKDGGSVVLQNGCIITQKTTIMSSS